MAGQAQSVQLPKRWPLSSTFRSRSSATVLTKDSRLINGYAEYDPETKEYQIWKRPGTKSTNLAGSYPNGCGIYTDPASGYILWVAMSGLGGGNTAYLYCSGTGTPSTPISTISMPYNFPSQVSFCTLNSSPQTVMVMTGQAGYSVNLSSFAVTKITDVAFPAVTVPGWVYLDATLYCMDPSGNIWNAADLNNGTVWTPASEIQADNNSELGVCLTKQLTYVVAMKQSITQIFYDAGNATGSPLSVVPDAQIPLGCLSANSVVSLDSTVLWVTATASGQAQVARLDNLTPKVISTPAVERVLDSISFFGGSLGESGGYLPTYGIWAFPIKLGGHRFYVLNLIQNNITLVYDIDQDLWQIWTDQNGNYWPFVASAYSQAGVSPFETSKILQHLSNDSLFYVDGNWNYTTDNGSPIVLDLYTGNEDFGTIRDKDLSMIYFNGDKVAGSKLLVRHSNDDYNTWSNFREVDLSLNKPRLWNNGSFHRRAYHLRHSGNTSFRLRSMDLEMDLGVE